MEVEVIMETAKQPFAKIRLHGGNSYVLPLTEPDALSTLAEEMLESFNCNDVGQKWDVELVAMTQEEYESMPEFEGHYE